MQKNYIPNIKNVRKWQKLSTKGVNSNNSFISYGEIALVAVNQGLLYNKQLQRLNLLLSKIVKKRGQFWLPTISHIAKTKKPSNARMGKGKGPIDSWVAKIKPNAIILLLAGLTVEESNLILRRIKKQLPFSCRIVTRYKTMFKKKAALSPKIIPF